MKFFIKYLIFKIINGRNHNVNESPKTKMKTSNFDGTEFTFNENLNFKPNLNDNSSQL